MPLVLDNSQFYNREPSLEEGFFELLNIGELDIREWNWKSIQIDWLKRMLWWSHSFPSEKEIDELYKKTNLWFFNITEWWLKNYLEIFYESKLIQRLVVENLWNLFIKVDDLVLFIKIISKLDNRELEYFWKIIKKAKTEDNLTKVLTLWYFLKGDFNIFIDFMTNSKSSKLIYYIDYMWQMKKIANKLKSVDIIELLNKNSWEIDDILKKSIEN